MNDLTVWVVLGAMGLIFWIKICAWVSQVAVWCLGVAASAATSICGHWMTVVVFLLAGFLSWIAVCIKVGEPITTAISTIILNWIERQLAQLRYIRERREMMEAVVSYSQNAVDAGEIDGQLASVPDPTGPKTVVTVEFDLNRAHVDPQRRKRAVRLCALLVRGGLGASSTRRSDAQVLVAEEWLRRQLEQLYDGAYRAADMAWIVPIAVDMAYSVCSIDIDKAQLRRTRAMAEMNTRVAGGSVLVRVIDRLLGIREAAYAVQ